MDDSTTSKLLNLAAQNDSSAVSQLMTVHRARIRKMVAIRLDQNLLARVDPSDVVQETMIEASRQLPQYLEHRRIGFYPWLREIAVNRLIQLYRRHVLADKRSIRREQSRSLHLPDESCLNLARRLVHSGTSPSGQVERREARQRVRLALDRLADDERELLVLKYLEEMTAEEIADVLGITERTVWRRHGRAIERIGMLLEKGWEE